MVGEIRKLRGRFLILKNLYLLAVIIYGLQAKERKNYLRGETMLCLHSFFYTLLRKKRLVFPGGG